ncbi:Uncharacterized protein Adt_01774 [Abeliophyllum distichum]|uniref:Uncharacterized protein n=1 Tax=Abeliophyllum distichum TaxID=126358 RepID=A0ABD1VTT2_9LAMI
MKGRNGVMMGEQKRFKYTVRMVESDFDPKRNRNLRCLFSDDDRTRGVRAMFDKNELSWGKRLRRMKSDPNLQSILGFKLISEVELATSAMKLYGSCRNDEAEMGFGVDEALWKLKLYGSCRNDEAKMGFGVNEGLWKLQE